MKIEQILIDLCTDEKFRQLAIKKVEGIDYCSPSLVSTSSIDIEWHKTIEKLDELTPKNRIALLKALVALCEKTER